MISGIFGKTKPINYVILFGLLTLLFGFITFYPGFDSVDTRQSGILLLTLLILLFSVLVMDFVVNRNQITSTNSYVALYFVLLALIFPTSVVNINAVGCNFFLVLACRRLISLRSLKNMKLKIFDATLWVLAASLFFSWTLIFLFLVYIAIYIYEPKNLKNWLVPVVGIIAFLLIWNAVLFLSHSAGFFEEHYRYDIFNWEKVFRDWIQNTKLIVFILIISITGLAVFLKSRKLGLGRIIHLRVFTIYFSLSMVVVLLSLTDVDFPILLTFFPAAVFLGKYTEMIKRKNIREMALTGVVLSAFLIFMIEVLSK
jgi:hypothetical protein